MQACQQKPGRERGLELQKYEVNNKKRDLSVDVFLAFFFSAWKICVNASL
jgi:hypothetical protein